MERRSYSVVAESRSDARCYSTATTAAKPATGNYFFTIEVIFVIIFCFRWHLCANLAAMTVGRAIVAINRYRDVIVRRFRRGDCHRRRVVLLRHYLVVRHRFRVVGVRRRLVTVRRSLPARWNGIDLRLLIHRVVTGVAEVVGHRLDVVRVWPDLVRIAWCRNFLWIRKFFNLLHFIFLLMIF